MTNGYFKKLSNRELKKNAKNLLLSRGVLLPIILSLIALVSAYGIVQTLSGAVYYAIVMLFPAAAQWISVQIAIVCVFDFVGVLLTAPLLFGVYRLVWRFTEGGDHRLTEMFYYFSPKKYGRALIGFAIAVLPAMLYIGGVSFVSSFINDLFTAYVSFDNQIVTELVKWLVTSAFCIIAFGFATLLLIPYGRLYSVIAAIVCEDDLPIGKCIKNGICATKKQSLRIFLFRLSFIFWVLLSICTIGMLFLLFTAPYMLVSYFYYNAELFGKEIKPVTSMEVTFDER